MTGRLLTAGDSPSKFPLRTTGPAARVEFLPDTRPLVCVALLPALTSPPRVAGAAQRVEAAPATSAVAIPAATIAMPAASRQRRSMFGIPHPRWSMSDFVWRGTRFRAAAVVNGDMQGFR
jgi:hypothetical protein